MSLIAQANLYCSEQDIQNLLSASGELARLDDDGDGAGGPGPSGTGSAGFLQAANYATARVKFYCLQHYEDADLASSYLVNEWASIIAAAWLCARRGNPVPESIDRLLHGDGAKDGGAMGDLADVRAKRATIPDIGYRFQDCPAWSNVRLDARYRVKQVRVEQVNSQRTPTQYAQAVDQYGNYLE